MITLGSDGLTRDMEKNALTIIHLKKWCLEFRIRTVINW